MTEKRKTNGHSKPEDFLLPRFEEVELPSGMHARLQPPSLDMWMLFGELPGQLHAKAQAAQGSAGEPLVLTPQQQVAWIHHVICYLFIEPRFSTKDEPGTFHPSQLRGEDRQFVLKWMGKFKKAGGGDGLVKFRSESGQPGSDGPGGEEVRQSSK